MTDTMPDFEHARLAACPACVVGDGGAQIPHATVVGAGAGVIQLSVPQVHCAACISLVEKTLSKMPGVEDAQVNLSRKRVNVRVEPGVTPEALISALDGVGYDAAPLDAETLRREGQDREGRDLLMRIGVAAFAMMNVMLLSVSVWAGAEGATRDLFHWISAVIALPAIAFASQPFFRHALRAVRVGRLNMDVPISLAILLASAMSLYETTQGGDHAYFDAALSLCFFLLGGRWLDHRTRASARSAATELAALELPTATRLGPQGEEVVDVATLIPGDTVVVRPGGRVPVDGVITVGASELDRAILTGETAPVAVAKGAEVHAGEISLTGRLEVTTTAAGQDTHLRRMADLVALAETARNRYTSLADRAAAIYAPAVHLLAFGAFVGWYWFGGDLRHAINIAVATLIITCPCALGLAVPAVSTAASGRLFKQGLLLKSATALERLAVVDTVVFDKTGTLTLGAPNLTPGDWSDADLALAAALGTGSAHPLAQALVEEAAQRGLDLPSVSDLAEVPGQGVQGVLNGQIVRLGRAGWTGAEAGTGTVTTLSHAGRSVCFAFTDRPRPGAREAVAGLRALGLEVRLLSGDSAGAVAALAEELGIANWRAEVLPEDKAEAVATLKHDGARVLMVGDGLNDTAALAGADVSIAPGSGLDASRAVSDVVLLGQSLAPLPEAVRVSRSAVRRMKENFAIAAGYNAVAIPLALMGLATPLMAALAMSGSSITVSLNALRLRAPGRKEVE